MTMHLRPVAILLLSIATANLMPRIASALGIEEATIAELHAAYSSGEHTTRQVVAAYLARIEAYDKRGPYLNSLISINPRALEEADALDAKLRATGKLVGPLHGIPVIVKDCIDALDMPMTAGFQGWKNYYPPSDAPLISRIKAAGGIILAKASLSEFTRGGADNINSVLGGFARNPYNTAFATGGSSGGTGAAIAANFGAIGIGTDTGGSIRNPSAHNALAGIRTSVGLVPRIGMTPNNSVRDTVGPMTRTVADLAILLDTMAGPEANDAASQQSKGHIPKTYTSFLKKDGLQGARIGVLRQEFAIPGADPRIIANFEKTLAELKAAGADIVDPFVVPGLAAIPRPPQTPARFKADIEAFLAARPDIPFPSLRAIVESRLLHPLHQELFETSLAAKPPEADPATIEGLRNEQLYRELFTTAMQDGRIDAVVLPTSTRLPVINGDRNTQTAAVPQPRQEGGAGSAGGGGLTFLGSSLQWPAISVPNGYIDGLPLGMQILGRRWDEAKIIQYAYAYEQATRHRRPPPTVPPLTAAYR